MSESSSSLTCTGEDFPMTTMPSLFKSLNQLSGNWMSFLLCRHEWKAGSIPFLVELGLFTNFGKHLFLIVAGSLLLIHFRNILLQYITYHSRYQTKGCLNAGIILNSGIALCFRRWTSGSTHSLISVSAFAIMCSLSMPILVTYLEMESCLWGFKFLIRLKHL